MDQWPLPEGWEWKQTKDVLKMRSGNVDPRDHPDTMFALYSMPAYDVDMRPEIVPGREIGSAKRKTYASDCLFSRLNPRIPRVWIVDEHEEQAVCSTDFITWIDRKRSGGQPWFVSEYLRYLLLSPNFRAQVTASVQGATGSRQRIKRDVLKKSWLPVPPLDVQRRLVARIETLLAEVDAARRLHAKIEEESEELMDAVLQDTFYQVESAFPSVAPLDSITQVTSGGTPLRSRSEYYTGDIPWVKTGELNDGLILESKEHITPLAVEDSNAKLFPQGTVLIAMYGQGKTRGRTGILGIPATTNQACCALLPASDVLLPQYLQFWFRSMYRDLRRQSEMRGGNQPNLNAGMIKSLQPPLPPLPEQHRIVAYLDEVQTHVAGLRAAAAALAADLERTEQAILARAFRGEL